MKRAGGAVTRARWYRSIRSATREMTAASTAPGRRNWEASIRSAIAYKWTHQLIRFCWLRPHRRWNKTDVLETPWNSQLPLHCFRRIYQLIAIDTKLPWMLPVCSKSCNIECVKLYIACYYNLKSADSPARFLYTFKKCPFVRLCIPLSNASRVWDIWRYAVIKCSYRLEEFYRKYYASDIFTLKKG